MPWSREDVPEGPAAEARRKRLLGEADGLLDAVEELRLLDRRRPPAALVHAIAALQQRLGRRSTAPATLAAAHRLVLALESRLMTSNPRVAAPSVQPERPVGQPVVQVLQGGVRWKLLSLPAPPPSGADAEWVELLDATVERAWDRWAYAHEQSVRAARERRAARAARARQEVAWANYWDLSEEVARLRLQAGRRPART